MIHVIDLLEVTASGPEAKFNNKKPQEVFLSQGSLDGACGPYSIFMGLLTIGVVKRDEVISFNADGRKRLGKLINKLNKDYSTLFKDGTDLSDLESIISETYGSLINTLPSETKNKDVLSFTLKQLKKNHPTIIGVAFSGGAHWMLAVGYEVNSVNETVKLLLLDPSGEKPIVSSWNSIIGINSNHPGIYPYKWWSESKYIKFEHAISMWKK